MVTRNPCLHPGDIKVVQAVDIKDVFDHFLNVIVFPKAGNIPITNQMAGGDLDGDQYFITWDKNLIPEQSYKSFAYHESPPK